MIDIENIRKYFLQDKIFMTEHAAERFRQRNKCWRNYRTIS